MDRTSVRQVPSTDSIDQRDALRGDLPSRAIARCPRPGLAAEAGLELLLGRDAS